ncbi:GNAT family N-acetyltransferase [Bacillus sp. JCM 19041]|uniref:GNAT family N-acetyltransferase n=1 Tax=Bacillus sp. JCM 19041 TaxID=1460637 RepID=UPI0006D2C24E
MIRPATAADAHELYIMLQHSFKKYAEASVPASALTETPSSLEHKLSTTFQAYLYVADGHVVGVCMYQFINGACHFHRLCVHSHHQGKGISKKLLQQLETRAIEQGCTELYCESRFSNCSYYLQQNYSITNYNETTSLYLLKKILTNTKKAWQCA